MEQSLFVQALRNPLTYGPSVTSVRLLQTHISFVAVTDNYVYKIKKSVNFGFLDFSTLEKRKYFCEEEVRLNKRLCPDLYIGVVRLTKTKEGGLEINGTGPLVDYALQMEQFPQEKIMTAMLQEGTVSKAHIDTLCNTLLDFYRSYPSTEEIQQYGRFETVKQNIDENFDQTQDVIDHTISRKTYSFLKDVNNTFFEQCGDMFQKRIDNDCIRDCHGDLHSGNIVLLDTTHVYIFDCIEFNKRFRFIDSTSDIAFLAMDLDYHAQFYLSSYFIHTYSQKSHDPTMFDVLNFYKCYRSYVRGKVIGFQLNDPHISKEKQNEILSVTHKYYDLSKYYAELLSNTMQRTRPILFIISGLPGTGKSTLALKLSVDYHAEIINTDVIRKHMAGIDTYQHQYEEPNRGLYDPKRVKQTYEKVLDLARTSLGNNRSVILDATFQQKEYRTKAYGLAQETNAVCVPILCTVPDHIAQSWLEKRMNERTVSDGRLEIYLAMKKTFERYSETEPHVVVDMSMNTYEEQMNQYRMILSIVNQR
jgi:aminoglycoside phosphotransferase family enzyme/predicted kinase